MSVKQITPYLNFDGNADAAIEHYRSALGAELNGDVMRFGDLEEHPFGPEAKDRVMHAELKLDGLSLMLSDIPPGRDLERSGDVNVVLEYDDRDELLRRFDTLAGGGEVTMAPHQAFWGATFGMLTDKFGIHWMLSGPPEAR